MTTALLSKLDDLVAGLPTELLPSDCLCVRHRDVTPMERVVP
ncbi:hypothetical protein [Nocardia sp. NPDC055049]